MEPSQREKTFTSKIRITSRNGKIKWISNTCQPVYNELGEFAGRRSSNLDISDITYAQEA